MSFDNPAPQLEDTTLEDLSFKAFENFSKSNFKDT